MERFGQVRANCMLTGASGSVMTTRVSNLRSGRLEHCKRACRVRLSAQPGETKTETSENEKQGDGQMKIRRRPPDGPEGARMANILWKVDDSQVQLDNKPRNILEEIVWYKSYEVNFRRDKQPLGELKKQLENAPPARNFVAALRQKRDEQSGKPALIAEVKKASPSKGVIKEDFEPVAIAQAYEKGGAACISVLTDEKYFQGAFENLQKIREAGVSCPLLCKEFIIEAYQVFMARAHGADAALLITAVLSDQDLRYFIKVLKSLNMAALVEVHSEEEMDRVLALGDQVLSKDHVLIGINNRDLQSFKVDLGNTEKLLEGERGRKIRELDILCVGESGIFKPEDIDQLSNAGVGAILVGESLVKEDDIEAATKELMSDDMVRPAS